MRNAAIFTFPARKYSAILLMTFSLCITFAISLYFGLTIRELLQQMYARQSTSISNTISNRVQSYTFLLEGMQSAMQLDSNFAETDCIHYLTKFVDPSIYPGIMEAGFVGETEYRIAYRKNLATRIPKNQAAALEKARQTGTFSTTIENNKEIFIYLPVFATVNGEIVKDPEQIRDFVFTRVDISEMFQEIHKMGNIMAIKINAEPYYSTEKTRDYLPFMAVHRNVSVPFFDRQWPISLTMYPTNELYDHSLFLILIFIFGLSCSFLVYHVYSRQYHTQENTDNLERQKDEFVAIASHELKTPLTSIKALNQLLAEKFKDEKNPLYDSYFRKTDSQIRRMEHLIADLMDVSKIRANKLTYVKTWFDLDSLVRSISEDMQEVKKSHRISVDGSLKNEIYADKDRVAQVITNLLNNAIKYSPQANLVLVGMKQTTDDAVITIQDFGIGITKDHLKRIFERFYRVSGDERKYQGMGIGLFISSEIIQKHGGKIWAKSTVGKGASFIFTLPLKPANE